MNSNKETKSLSKRSMDGSDATPLNNSISSGTRLPQVTFEETTTIRSRNETAMDNSMGQSQGMSYLELNLKRKSQMQYFEKEFSFERFTNGDIQQISITVLGTEKKLFKYKTYKIEVKSPFFPDIHCFRRYNEFQALYKVLKLKYQNIQLPSFPSKFTLLNRTEKRRVAFHRILNGILEIAQQHHGQIQKNILQLLYVFLTKDLSGKQSTKVEIGQGSYGGQSESFDDISEFSIDNIIGLEQFGDEFKDMQLQFEEGEEEDNDSNDKSASSVPDRLLGSPDQKLEKSTTLDLSSHELRNRSSAQQFTNHTKKLSLNLDYSSTQKGSMNLVNHRTNTFESGLSNSGSQDQKSAEKPNQPVIIEKIVHLNDIEEKDYCGYIKVSLQNDTRKYLFARIVQNSLQLFQHIFDNHFACLISIYEAQIQYHPKNSHIIEIFHDYDSKRVQICLENDNVDDYYLENNDPVQDINEYMQNLLNKNSDLKSISLVSEKENEKYIPPSQLQKWLGQLKFATQKKQDINLNDFVFEPIGKMYLSIHEILNFKNILPNSTVYVRIKSSPFTFQTKENISDTPKWKQDYIFNSYGLITLEVVSVTNDGWIKEKFIHQVIATVAIQIADILGHNQDTTFRKISLPLENTDQRKKYLTKKGIKDQKDQDMQIIISLRNLSKFESIFAESSNNIYDGVKMSEQQKSIFRYYKINFNRYKRVSGSVFLFIWSFNDIFYQKYPQFSKLMLFIFLLFIWNANLNNILLHLLALLLFIIIAHNPKIFPYYEFLTDKYLFSQKHESYHEPLIYTKKMNDYIKMSQCLSKIKKINNDIIVEEQIQFTLSQTYQQLKKSFYLLHEWISIVVNFCEKFKNLLTWKDQNRTYQFFIFLIFLYVIFTHVPMRMILFFGCIYNYAIGSKVYERRYNMNMQQGKNLVRYVYKKYQTEVKKVEWSTLKKFTWESIENEKFPNEQFKKMLIEEGLTHFYLWLTEENLKDFDTPKKLMEAIATVPKKLFMNKIEGPHQSTEIYKELQRDSKLKLSKYLTTVKIWKNFLYNIPSDCYRILHPKMI